MKQRIAALLSCNRFIDECISSGKCVESDIPEDLIINIEEILNKYNDKTAKSKIKKLLKDRAT